MPEGTPRTHPTHYVYLLTTTLVVPTYYATGGAGYYGAGGCTYYAQAAPAYHATCGAYLLMYGTGKRARSA